MHIISLAFIIGALAYGAYLYPALPDQLASHWGAAGDVNGTMPKFWGVLFAPLMALGLYLLFALVIPRIDPLRQNIAAFRPWYNWFVVILTAFMAYVQVLTLVWNSGTHFNMAAALMPSVGVLIFCIGILLRHSKRNWFIGIRTPWTLSSDRVWDETHRLGATLFQISGVLIVLSIFVPQYTFAVTFASLIGTALVTVVYSYILFRREERQ